MSQCLSNPLKANEGVRGAFQPENLLAYCGAGVAGRWGEGVAIYIKRGVSWSLAGPAMSWMKETACLARTSVK